MDTDWEEPVESRLPYALSAGMLDAPSDQYQRLCTHIAARLTLKHGVTFAWMSQGPAAQTVAHWKNSESEASPAIGDRLRPFSRRVAPQTQSMTSAYMQRPIPKNSTVD